MNVLFCFCFFTTVHLSVRRSMSADSLYANSSSTPDPSFGFLPFDNVTTCGVYNIRWTVSNPELANLTDVIDLDVAGAGDNSTLSNTTIARHVPVPSAHFAWNPVNVRPGQYQILGRWSDEQGAVAAVQSQVFDVKTGNTTACLADPASTSPASLTPSIDAEGSGSSHLWVLLVLAIIVLVIALGVTCVVGYLRRGRGENASITRTGIDVGVAIGHLAPSNNTNVAPTAPPPPYTSSCGVPATASTPSSASS